MKLHYDEDANALYLRLNSEQIVESEEVQPNIVLDFDRNGQVIGIEILRVTDRVPIEELRRIQFEFA